MKKVIVIGGGPAGMMSAIYSAKNGNQVTLIEKNEKLGKKLYITGKGRCNLSNYCDEQEFLSNVCRNDKFLFSAIRSFSPKNACEFFEDNGLKLKVERGNRIFPNSDKASDVTKCLEKIMDSLNVNVKLNEIVEAILTENNEVKGVKTNLSKYECESVIICTGGVSYSLTGSTGDGYVFAKTLGHTVVDVKPSLVGLCLKGGDYCDLQGLSLKNVAISFSENNKVLYNDFGELLFTHFGVSGPIILSCSAKVNRCDFNNSILSIDLKPALTFTQLTERLIRDFSINNIKSIGSYMHELVPKTLIGLILSRAKIRADKKCGEIKKEERNNLVSTLKNLAFNVKGLRNIEEAIVTSGGVNVKEINPKTMESKIVKGLFFAGEVIDVDAFTGGFNIQCALSTGYLAGVNS